MSFHRPSIRSGDRYADGVKAASCSRKCQDGPESGVTGVTSAKFQTLTSPEGVTYSDDGTTRPCARLAEACKKCKARTTDSNPHASWSGEGRDCCNHASKGRQGSVTMMRSPGSLEAAAGSVASSDEDAADDDGDGDAAAAVPVVEAVAVAVAVASVGWSVSSVAKTCKMCGWRNRLLYV